MSRIPCAAVIVLATVGLGACSAPQAETPLRSPSRDYPPSDAQTSNGEVVGADRQPPGDKLVTGPRVGPDGVTLAGPATHGKGGGGKPAGTPAAVPAK